MKRTEAEARGRRSFTASPRFSFQRFRFPLSVSGFVPLVQVSTSLRCFAFFAAKMCVA